MKRLCLIAGMLALVFAAATPALALSWGDFEVVDSLFETDVSFFLEPDAVSNPAPFPVPAYIQQAATYPSIINICSEVWKFEDYLSNNGFDPDTFGLEVTVKPNSSVNFASMVITIGGTTVAASTGSLSMINGLATNAKFYLLPQLDLSSYNDNDKILISYDTLNGYTNLKSIKMAATPEPVSMAFLGTGLLGLVFSRVRRRRR